MEPEEGGKSPSANSTNSDDDNGDDEKDGEAGMSSRKINVCLHAAFCSIHTFRDTNYYEYTKRFFAHKQTNKRNKKVLENFKFIPIKLQLHFREREFL